MLRVNLFDVSQIYNLCSSAFTVFSQLLKVFVRIKDISVISKKLKIELFGTGVNIIDIIDIQ